MSQMNTHLCGALEQRRQVARMLHNEMATATALKGTPSPYLLNIHLYATTEFTD